jgi:hypothetical protein
MFIVVIYMCILLYADTVNPANDVTSIKQSPVLKGMALTFMKIYLVHSEMNVK